MVGQGPDPAWLPVGEQEACIQQLVQVTAVHVPPNSLRTAITQIWYDYEHGVSYLSKATLYAQALEQASSGMH